MDLSSYADLAIELVNTRGPAGDSLRDLEGLHALLVRRPHLGGRLGHRDLDAMRALREQLHAVFLAAARGDEEDAIERLNALLIHHPIHPQLSAHDGLRPHLHLNEGGSIPDRYAARAAMGLTVKVGEHGLDRLGICRAAGCGRVFFDTTANRSRRYCSDRCAGRPSVAAASHPPHPRVSAELERPRPDGTPELSGRGGASRANRPNGQ